MLIVLAVCLVVVVTGYACCVVAGREDDRTG